MKFFCVVTVKSTVEISKKNAAFSEYMNFKVLLLQLVPSFLIVFNSICQGIEVGSKCLSFLVYNSVLTFEVQQYEFSPSFFVELKKDSCMGGHCRRCI